MAALIAHPELAEAIEALVNGPDAYCNLGEHDLYEGIDRWTVCTTDDGSGGAEEFIVCSVCEELEFEACLDMAAGL